MKIEILEKLLQKLRFSKRFDQNRDFQQCCSFGDNLSKFVIFQKY